MAPRILIFSIAMGAEYLSYVKSIATFAPTIYGYIISVLASVYVLHDFQIVILNDTTLLHCLIIKTQKFWSSL